MTKKLLSIACVVIFMTTALFAKEEKASISIKIFNEVVSTKLPKTWRYKKPAFHQMQKGMYIIEFLPKKQNFDNWKEMFTIQGFNNLAIQDGMSSVKLEKIMQKSYQDLSKENFIYKGKKEFNIGRHKAVVSLMGCSNVPKDLATVKKGEGEVGLYLFVKGKQDVYILHKSWKTKAFKKENMPIKQKQIDMWKNILINQTKIL